MLKIGKRSLGTLEEQNFYSFKPDTAAHVLGAIQLVEGRSAASTI